MSKHELSEPALPSPPSVAIVGPGAIGTTVGAALHEAGRTPMLCGRTARSQLELQINEGLIVVPVRCRSIRRRTYRRLSWSSSP
ncbi:2-dehydropantoate 2-reductase N-terminal domain-containing protein [Mycobacteroides abscessus]